MRVAPALVVLTLSASLLAGCGGNDTEAYCKELKKDKSAFSINSGKEFEAAAKNFHKLADMAPEAVAKDWKTIDTLLTSAEKALKDAGLKPTDLDGISSGKLPEGVDQSKIEAVGKKLQKLDTDGFEKAGKAIEKHAKKECKVDISGS